MIVSIEVWSILLENNCSDVLGEPDGVSMCESQMSDDCLIGVDCNDEVGVTFLVDLSGDCFFLSVTFVLGVCFLLDLESHVLHFHCLLSSEFFNRYNFSE